MGTDGGLKEEMVVMVENVDIVEAAKMEESMGAMVEKVNIEEARCSSLMKYLGCSLVVICKCICLCLCLCLEKLKSLREQQLQRSTG